MIAKQQFEMAKLVSEISSCFARISSADTDREILSALRRIGEFAGADRSYVFLISQDEDFLHNTHSWCADGIPKEVAVLRDIPCGNFPWLMSELRKGETVRIEDVSSDVPADADSERKELLRDDIKSALIFPLFFTGRLGGFAGFDRVRETVTWKDYDVTLLQMFSVIIAHVLERLRSEEALKESEEKFRALTESATDAIIIIDNNSKIVYWNTSSEFVFGYTAAEAMGKEVHSLIAPKRYHEPYKKGFSLFRSTGQGPAVGKTFEFPAVTKDGREFQIELSISAFTITGNWHAAAVIRDITDRRRMEEFLFEEKRFAENLIDNSAAATFIIDTRHRVVLWNKACEELTGIPASLIIGTDDHWRPFYDSKRQTVADVIIDGNAEVMSTLYEKHSRSALMPGGLQAEGWYKDLGGRKRYILFEAAPLYNSRGEMSFVIETLLDITERKKAEEELDIYRNRLETLVIERTAELEMANELLQRDIEERRLAEEALRLSEARFEEAQRVARLGTWEWNIVSGRVYWSDEVFRIFGLVPHQIVPGKETIFDYIHHDDREAVKQALEAAVSENQPYSVDARVVSEETNVVVHMQGKTYSDSSGNPLIMLGNIQDITERKRMEDEILKAQKLESIGVLAGGIAHDFNNLLSAILGNISVAKLYTDPKGLMFERLYEAERASLRAKDLAQQLLTYSKGGDPIKKVVSLSDLIKDAADFALRGSNICSEFSIPEDLSMVEVDEGQMVQVFNNIVINAKQSMPGGGRILIRCENISVHADTVMPLPDGNYVKISIEDQGGGIHEEHIEKIFDPYFTTKEEGSGLGLTTSYSIIKKHGGYITVESLEDSGTTFHIYLPVYLPASAAGFPKALHSRKTLIRGKGKILVMDDEDIIRLIVGKMLAEMGYEAAFAEDGQKAIDQYASAMSAGSPFDAVIIDLTIRGGMGGMDCLKHLLTIDPGVTAIVSSGYSDDPVMAKFEDFGFKGVITKPYQLEDLSEILHSLIDRTDRELPQQDWMLPDT